MPKISSVPSSGTPTPTDERAPLAEHQRAGIEWITRVERGLLADEPGLGKSRVAIEAFDGGKVLVVAPAMVINGGTWEDELAKWANHPEGFVVAPYSQLNARIKTGNGSGSRPVNALRPELKGNWDALVIDEAHYVKNRGTSWTWASVELAKHSGAVLPMTGTPVPNWAHEIFMLLRLVRPADAKPGGILGSHQRWLDEWFRQVPDRHDPSGRSNVVDGLLACGRSIKCMTRPANDPCEHWLEFVQENLGERFLRRLRDDVLDLPPMTEQTIKVELDASARRMYKELKADYLTNTELGTEVVAWTNGARNVMLDRITTSGWFMDKDGEPRGGKLDRLQFDLEGRSAPTLVLAHYQDTVDACARVAERTGARVGVVRGGVSQSGANAKSFKEGKLDVLVGSLEMVAEGLTFTNADMAIFVEKSFKPSRNEQAKRRIHRMGQTRPVTVLDYVAPATVDSNKRILLDSKTDQQMRMMTAAEMAKLL